MKLDVEAVIHNPRLREVGGLPVYATAGAAAMDLRSCEEKPVTIWPQMTYSFDLGFSLYIRDPGVAGFILPRSGLGTKGLVLANSTGLIDSDYQGPLSVKALNRNHFGGKPITVNPGDRIFQIVFLPVVLATLRDVESFSERTERGVGGYGSTGA